MEITLNHTIVPSHDKVESAKFYSKIFGFEYVGEFARFIVVRVNKTLCLDFANSEKFEPHHYAFKVSEQEFDEIFIIQIFLKLHDNVSLLISIYVDMSLVQRLKFSW